MSLGGGGGSKGPSKADIARQQELTRQQADILKQQEREKAQRSAEAEKQRITLLRGRFGGAGGSGGGAADGGNAESLYNRITGK